MKGRLMKTEQLAERELAEEAEMLGGNLLHWHFAYHLSYMT
jgi:hypothetical protein